MFDKPCIRFSNKFAAGVSTVGHGKMIATVCCKAIVCVAVTKDIKVEFDVTRIYEETLNCLV